MQTQQIERETLIVDNKDNFQRKAQIELELQDLQGETEQRDVKRDDLKKELAKYDKLLHDSEQKLARIVPEYDLLRREEEQKTAQYVTGLEMCTVSRVIAGVIWPRRNARSSSRDAAGEINSAPRMIETSGFGSS